MFGGASGGLHPVSRLPNAGTIATTNPDEQGIEGFTRAKAPTAAGGLPGPDASESQPPESSIEMTVAHGCFADLGGEPKMPARIYEDTDSGRGFVGDREAA
jgi:hypothetical protein